MQSEKLQWRGLGRMTDARYVLAIGFMWGSQAFIYVWREETEAIRLLYVFSAVFHIKEFSDDRQWV